MSGTTAQGSGSLSLAQLVSTLAPVFLGSGASKTNQTDTSTTTASPDAIAALTSAFNTAQGNATNSSNADSIVQNIIRNAQVAFAPNLAKGAGAGIYNSSTLQQLASEATANATGEASQAVLSYQTAQQQIAQAAATGLTNATKTTTGTTAQTTTKAPTIPTPVSAALALGLTGYSNRDKILKAIGLDGSDNSTGTPAVDTTNLPGGITGDASDQSWTGVVAPSDTGAISQDVTSSIPVNTFNGGDAGSLTDAAASIGGGIVGDLGGDLLDSGSAVASIGADTGSALVSDIDPAGLASAAAGGLGDITADAGGDAAAAGASAGSSILDAISNIFNF